MDDFCNSVESSLHTYISKISSKFNLPSNELASTLKDVCQKHFIHNIKLSRQEEKIRLQEEAKLKRATVNKQCRHKMISGVNKGKRCPGKVCVDSITGEFCKTHIKQESTFAVLIREDNQKIITKLNSQRPCLDLEMNEYGNFEHRPTNFCFDRITKKVFGKQVGDKVLILTKEDIELCKEYFFDFLIPETFREEEEKELKADDETDNVEFIESDYEDDEDGDSIDL